MLKDSDQPEEPLRNKAARMWNNNNVRKKLTEAQQKAKAPDPHAPPRMAQLIINERKVDGRGSVQRFESKRKKEFREMMEGYTKANLAIYLISLEHRRRILLKEKLRRLKLALARQEADVEEVRENEHEHDS